MPSPKLFLKYPAHQLCYQEFVFQRVGLDEDDFPAVCNKAIVKKASQVVRHNRVGLSIIQCVGGNRNRVTAKSALPTVDQKGDIRSVLRR